MIPLDAPDGVPGGFCCHAGTLNVDGDSLWSNIETEI